MIQFFVFRGQYLFYLVGFGFALVIFCLVFVCLRFLVVFALLCFEGSKARFAKCNFLFPGIYKMFIR